MSQQKFSPQEMIDIQRQNTLTMQRIVQEMKHPDVIEREKQEIDRVGNDISAIEGVDFPKVGGIHSKMEGHPQPYRGFPYVEFVDAIDGVKKLTKYFFQRLHYIVRNISLDKKDEAEKVWWLHEKLISALFYSIYRVIERHKIIPERYSQPVREIHRILTEMADMAQVERGENGILMFRDVFCMYLEFDNAYRFRFQDLMEDLDKEQGTTDPGREIKRLYELNIERELEPELKEKQTQYRDFLSFLFSLSGYKELASEFFKRLNIDEIKLSKEDKYWCAPRREYHFGGCERGEWVCLKHFKKTEYRYLVEPVIKNRLKKEILMIKEKIPLLKVEIEKIRTEQDKVAAEQDKFTLHQQGLHIERVRLEAQLELLLSMEKELEQKSLEEKTQ